MSTAAQVTANRANAQLSTGPVSAEGKAASSQNAFKFGIHAKSLVIPGEDPEEFEALARRYERDLAPRDAVETSLVETLVCSTWMLRRLARIEAEVLRTQMAALENPGENPLGEACIQDSAESRVLQSIARRQRAVQRDYFQALKLLREAHQARIETEMVRLQSRLTAAAPISSARQPEPAKRSQLPGPAPRPIAATPFDNPALRL